MFVDVSAGWLRARARTFVQKKKKKEDEEKEIDEKLGSEDGKGGLAARAAAAYRAFRCCCSKKGGDEEPRLKEPERAASFGDQSAHPGQPSLIFALAPTSEDDTGSAGGVSKGWALWSGLVFVLPTHPSSAVVRPPAQNQRAYVRLLSCSACCYNTGWVYGT